MTAVLRRTKRDVDVLQRDGVVLASVALQLMAAEGRPSVVWSPVLLALSNDLMHSGDNCLG